MHYSIEMQAESCLIIVSTSGAATFAGVKSFIYELVNPPYSEVDYNVLVDLQQLDMNSLTSTDIERIAGIVEANKNKIVPLKNALVVSSKLSFGLSRMYEMLAVDKGPQITRVFYSYDEAMAWLSADTP